jgi:hypothetical protein
MHQYPTNSMLQIVFWFRNKTGNIGLYLGVGIKPRKSIKAINNRRKIIEKILSLVAVSQDQKFLKRPLSVWVLGLTIEELSPGFSVRISD